MTEKEAELAIMEALAVCGRDEDCDSCPLYAEGNDESCASYIMALSRDPAAYEMRRGAVEPKGEPCPS